MKIKKTLLLASAVCSGLWGAVSAAELRIDELRVAVPSSREFSFSDKSAGFYYGMTGTDAWTDWNAGWNIRAKRIFTDYELYAGGKRLSKKSAATAVFPYKLERNYGSVSENFYLADNEKVIFIELDADSGTEVGIKLLGEMLATPVKEDNTVVYASPADENVIRIAPLKSGCDVKLDSGIVSSAAGCGGFVITFGSRRESLALVSDCREKKESWLSVRKDRMQTLVTENRLESNVRDLSKALAWIELTADELVTRQHGGWGIYAGFPWFTDFWGRDMFISMPGTVLCTGQFSVARDILLSFAKYQDMNPKSPTYGRVPNRLNLDGILYNTTDGTPRFVMQIYDYLKYTGDMAFVKQVYDHVKVATDASLELYTDENGYLTHADADTWMDAKRQGQRPCSPRGNRAVDIQALWYGQLVAASELAESAGKKNDAKRWREVAEKLKSNFAKDFVGRETGKIYDHLNADGTKDLQLRPNTMFAYELLDNDTLKMNDMRTLWSHLVYPWGVSSLDQQDEQFHPYHEQWHRYHKDDAYHNGTVWLWQNGQAMQRMIEYGQQDKAFRLFENMNRQALEQGAVGSLSECADAWCRPGRTWARRTGTFLQAWSNAEQIRVWQQFFLGVRPDLLNNEITVAPKLPRKIKNLETSMKIGDGNLTYAYKKYDGTEYFRFEWSGSRPVDVSVDVALFKAFRQTVANGGCLELELRGGKLTARNVAVDGHVAAVYTDDAPDPEKEAFAKLCNERFRGVKFAEPSYREDLKSMSRYFNPPLDYYSAE